MKKEFALFNDDMSINKENIITLVDPDFNDKNVIIVTGSSNGIGQATAIAAAYNGLQVVGLDINEEQSHTTSKAVEQLGGKFTHITTDLTNEQSMAAAIEQAAKLGKIKYLANIAGIQHINAIENFPIPMFDKMYEIMIKAPFYLSQKCIPLMENNRGVIMNMSSIHGHICTKNKSAYNIAKFSMRALSQSLSAEEKVRSFTVSVGFVDTPLMRNQVADQAKQRNITEAQVITDVMLGKSRIKRLMQSVEVANGIIYGMSRYADYLIGGDLRLDGGMINTY